MKTKTQKITLLFLTMSFMAFSVAAQQSYVATGTPQFTIAGTSTLHDWTMTSTGANYKSTIEVNSSGAIAKLGEVTVKLPAESLKSNEKAMDKNAYKSLKTDKYKEIVFALTSSKITQGKITCTGNLTIAGTTNPIEVDVTYEAHNGQLQFKGSTNLKMTDYKVEPPTFMFGTIKTGDEIKITFEVSLIPAK